MLGVSTGTAHGHDLAAAMRSTVSDRVASRIAAHDAGLWGREAVEEASIRLAWTHLFETARPLLAQVEAERERLHGRGLDHVVLCGMGGSSLGAEVICASAGKEITVLDSSDPDQVRAALNDRLHRSIAVIASKSGSTVETDSQRRVFESALRAEGLDPRNHLAVVTDPGSVLADEAREAGYPVFYADPEVGGRYSALTAFGLVPSGLAGVDIERLLDEARAAKDVLFADSSDNPALQLGVLLGTAHHHGVDKVAIVDQSRIGYGNWIEQLVAESTGKDGTGILPVVVPFANAVNFNPSTADSVLVAMFSDEVPEAQSGYAAAITGSLGATFLMWEMAVAVAGRMIGINPFDQPDVEAAKSAARGLLEATASKPTPNFIAEGTEIRVRASTGLRLDGHSTLDQAVAALLAELDGDRGYLAIQAYLSRLDYPELPDVRESLAARTGRPVTFGWGPRFLHSTGQYHKGGPETGVFLQISCRPRRDLEIPGRPFTFGEFRDAQAQGDAEVLTRKGRPLLHLDAADRHDIARIMEALS